MSRSTKLSIAALIALSSHTSNASNMPTPMDEVRAEVNKNKPGILHGHQIFTGIPRYDIDLTQALPNPLLARDFRAIRETRQEMMTTIKEQIRNVFGLMFAIRTQRSPEGKNFLDPEHSGFETDHLERDQKNFTDALNKGLILGDPVFPVLCSEHVAFMQELPNSKVKDLIQTALGLTTIPAEYPNRKNVLAFSLTGNTVAAHYVLHKGIVPKTWYESIRSNQAEPIQKIIDTLASADSTPFRYIFTQSLFKDPAYSAEDKMSAFKSMNTDATNDYWCVLSYADILMRLKRKLLITEEAAAAEWKTLFKTGLHLPITEQIVIRPMLQNPDEAKWPLGYKAGLYQFAGVSMATPFHLMMRRIVEKVKTKELSDFYLIRYFWTFPETKDLPNSAKIAEANAIGALVPQAKGLLAHCIAQAQPLLQQRSLGFYHESPEHRHELLENLAADGVEQAKDILAEANTGGLAGQPFDLFRIHLGYKDVLDIPEENRTTEDYLTISQERLARIFELALDGCKRAQDILVKPTPGYEHSVLEFYMNMNNAIGVTNFGEHEKDMILTAHRLLIHVFYLVNLINSNNDIVGGPVDFVNEAVRFITKEENMIYPEQIK